MGIQVNQASTIAIQTVTLENGYTGIDIEEALRKLYYDCEDSLRALTGKIFYDVLSLTLNPQVTFAPNGSAIVCVSGVLIYSKDEDDED